MCRRFVTIWFRHLITDWMIIRQPALKEQPFVVAAPEHGRMVITAASAAAQEEGISTGMVVADAKAAVAGLQVFDEKPGMAGRLLKALGKWCIRYTPVVAIDQPDGLILDASGCAHLWGGEEPYLKEIVTRLRAYGYDVRAAMADTIGTAWAVTRYGQVAPVSPGSGQPQASLSQSAPVISNLPQPVPVISNGGQLEALLPLPPAALRLEAGIVERLQKLGLYRISNFISMPRHALRRRFGQEILLRLDQALGYEEEAIEPLEPVQPYEERLPCLEPILTRTGIEIALERLLETLCARLQQEGKGLRTALLKCFRIDGRTEQVTIGTNRASHHAQHLFRLFENKIATLRPGPGIELFVLEAPKTEELPAQQETLWTSGCSLESIRLAELVDRLINRVGAHAIRRYLPDEHYWPERSVRQTADLLEKATTAWREDHPRPVQLLPKPEPVEVAAPIPDYPPMLFRYKGTLHRIKRADGPERIEREWWLEAGQHRDYYVVEDEEGRRYWLFRSGHYDADRSTGWFIHGFFA
ncbi:Y-family DNA polymerase [Chitinophaga cymbidii]|nr:DNA polymerase Y family protein [Chitinophaga cymbidii]